MNQNNPLGLTKTTPGTSSIFNFNSNTNTNPSNNIFNNQNNTNNNSNNTNIFGTGFGGGSFNTNTNTNISNNQQNNAFPSLNNTNSIMTFGGNNNQNNQGTLGNTNNLFGGLMKQNSTNPFNNNTGQFGGNNVLFGSNSNTNTTNNTIFPQSTTNQPLGTSNTINSGIISQGQGSTSNPLLQNYNNQNQQNSINNPLLTPVSTYNTMTGNQLGFPNVNYNQQIQPLNYTLKSNNSLKYEKLNNILDQNQKNVVYNIEQTLNNNEIILENNDAHLNDLEETKKVLTQECNNLIKLSKVVTTTQKNYKLIVEGLERDFKEQVAQLHKIKKNFNLIENNSSIKISCPSEFFESVLKDLTIKVDSINTRLSELESLLSSTDMDEVNFSSKEEGIQATIMAAHSFLINYYEESKNITDLVKKVKLKYFETMLEYGMSQIEIESRIQKYLEKKQVSN